MLGSRSWLAAALIGVGGLLLTACGAGPGHPGPARHLAPGGATAAESFVAISVAGTRRPHLERFSLPSGRALGPIQSAPAGTQVVSSVMSSSGQIWVTTASGPRLRNDTVGGDPAPNSCHSSVLELSPGGSRPSRTWRFGNSQLVGDAVPNPAGDRVAYLESGCTTSFADPHIVIRSLAGGRDLTIGLDAAPCHQMSSPSWSASGAQLTFTFNPSSLAPGSGPLIQGACPAWHLGELAVASTVHSSEMAGVRLVAAPSGCGYTAAAFDAWGIAVVETCGYAGMGPAHLVQLSDRLSVTATFALQPGSDPTWLSVAGGGRSVLVDEYQAPPATGPGGQARDWLYVFDGVDLHLVHVYPDASYGIRGASW